ncbi:hypothetical protein L3V59_37655 [Burkholderia aenigmatica]|uniref:hypothetical protein n=1 Tax=Burkholderia aenigmatica TaxID=2015348 RepID=UPI001F44531E|nr:hypothetical protein [Burkholderia aenigmatica]UKD17843.1 hypothetical protein L3V59_37655 [Burkholderia aenigmatica]
MFVLVWEAGGNGSGAVQIQVNGTVNRKSRPAWLPVDAFDRATGRKRVRPGTEEGARQSGAERCTATRAADAPIVTLSIMASGTILIAFVPGYATIGSIGGGARRNKGRLHFAVEGRGACNLGLFVADLRDRNPLALVRNLAQAAALGRWMTM